MSSFDDISAGEGATVSTDDMILRSANELAPLLRARRRELGLTQQALAELVGVNRTLIVLLESGKRPVRLDTTLVILHTLGMDLEVRVRGR
jgi:y4mF family transcriptional regulator